ncbi:unnamed protein product [Ostreobium quekettii]|uniref:Uncharacterized protein n=1 Tax=Ostreobium quekettii TaxID=121088 RepID=A0A8S1ILL8_9CHLO|nr:unnamed protein product [Ostreobium quekettii]
MERMKTCGTSSVPSRVELVEDLLSQLLQNVDDIIKHFVHTEHELELIRTRFQDRLNDNQASLERTPTSYGNSLKKHALKLQTSMDKSLRRELLAREKREFLELQRAEKKMNKHFLHLDDLMVAARLLRSRGFVRLLKQGRVKFRQMECLVDETQGLKAIFDDLESELAALELSLSNLERYFRRKQEAKQGRSAGTRSKVRKMSTRVAIALGFKPHEPR